MTKLAEIALKAKARGKKTRIAVAVAEDNNTIGAVVRAMQEGLIHPVLIGNQTHIETLLESYHLSTTDYELLNIPDETNATREAVRMVSGGDAEVLMKGLIGTDKFLKAVLDKQNGLLIPGALLSYTCALELPQYHKLLFVTDTAVVPNPDINQKIAMVNYSVEMARKLGIVCPKVALISSTEKVISALPNTGEYALISMMARREQINNCCIDGPLDIFLACDPNSQVIKGVQTPIAGEADILIFPSLESANSFYKGLMLFARAELAGLIQGTSKPVIVMSRSESELSKYYCIALSCLMTEDL